MLWKNQDIEGPGNSLKKSVSGKDDHLGQQMLEVSRRKIEMTELGNGSGVDGMMRTKA